MKLPVIIGIKGETKRVFNENGKFIPVTFIKTAPFYLLQVKKQEGATAIVVGHGLAKRLKKPQAGKLKAMGVNEPVKYVKQVTINEEVEIVVPEDKKAKPTVTVNEKQVEVGAVINPQDVLTVGEEVAVTGTSKGKGFQGVVKRHGFAGGPRTHGQSDRERAPGSIGQRMTPGRVFKGLKMAGRMGGDTVTVKGLKVHEVTEDGVYVTGVIPGSKQSVVYIKR